MNMWSWVGLQWGDGKFFEELLLPLFFLLPSFSGWMGDHVTFDVLFYLMIIWIYTCRVWYLSTRRTLICALCKRRQVYWDLAHKGATQGAHWCIQGPVDWHTIYIYTTCYVLTVATFIKLNDYFPQCLYSILKVIYLLIRCYKTRFFLWNTDNTDRNGANKQNTHTHTHTNTPNTGKG